MAVELKVPSVGESVTEVQIGDWLKVVGDRVAQDEPVVMIETDKVTVEVPAPVSGTITRIVLQKGADASVGDVIALMEPGAEREADEPLTTEPRVAFAAGSTELEAAPPPQSMPGTAAEPSRSSLRDTPAARPGGVPEIVGELKIMPAARRALEETGISPDAVTPTGRGGRMLKQDVVSAAEGESQSLSGQREAPPAPHVERPASVKGFDADREEEVVPMSLFRRRVAERLVQAQQSAALLTTFNEVDMSAVMELRREHQPAFQEKYRIKLGFMSFFVKAAVEALKALPAVNAEIRGRDIVYRNYYDVGVAVGGGRGLVVPVIRNAERLGFAEVEQTIADFAVRAKNNTLGLAELQGGTFTISNGGIYGSMLSTPIVNPPQSGILGLHAIQDRPVARAGQVVIRPMMYLALTYDHRLVDGREAVTFLKRVKECIEQPARILLEV